jgi:hypothetical protein
MDEGYVVNEHSQDDENWNGEQVLARKPVAHGGIITLPVLTNDNHEGQEGHKG